MDRPARSSRSPSIYHYAHCETTALKRLTGTHATVLAYVTLGSP
jgi:hypothetical protein